MATTIAFVEAPARGLDLPLDVRGTAFQQRVWRALREIPAGATVSYAALAARIGARGAVRAVARACATNAIAVAIPCHRVVRSDGALSGYRWGVGAQARLARTRGRVMTDPPPTQGVRMRRRIGLSVMLLESRREAIIGLATEGDRLGYDGFFMPEAWGYDMTVLLAEGSGAHDADQASWASGNRSAATIAMAAATLHAISGWTLRARARRQYPAACRRPARHAV